MNKEKTGQLIKEARTKSGLTQSELGDMLGVTNKAVSRWEKGESFPDVGVLESLSGVLHLKIEDIVTGGEQGGDVSETIADLVNTVKLQKKVARGWTVISTVAILYGILTVYMGTVIFGGYTYLARGAAISVLVSYMIFLLNISYTTPSASTVQNGIIRVSIVAIPAVPALYASIMLGICINDVTHDKIPFGLQTGKIGPFLNNQFAAIYIINALLAAILMIRSIRNRESMLSATILAVGACMLTLAYSDFLHNLSSPEETLKSVISLTGQFYFAVIISLITKWGIERKKKR